MIQCPFCLTQHTDRFARYCDQCGKTLTSLTPPRPRPVRKKSKSSVVLATGFIIGAVAFCSMSLSVVYKTALSKISRNSLFSNRTVESAADNSPATRRARLLKYLSEQNNSGSDFELSLLGKARIESYKTEAGEVYFSLPKDAVSPEAINQEISRFVSDPSKLQKASESNGRLTIEEFALDKRPDRAVLFKTSEDNINFDPATKLSFKFERGIYVVSLGEAVDYITNRNAQGGNLRVRSGERRDGRPVIFANHGTYVARKGEPSLTRFVEELTKDISANARNARELKIQRLLDFVTSEIVYDDDEARREEEVLKHPVEILISRHGDCSNKSILLGSLLEQLGENYLFLYCPGHITVAVERGKFPQREGIHWEDGVQYRIGPPLEFKWEGKVWAIAEGTVPGFEIGKTFLQDEEIFQQVEFVQHPRERNQLYDAHTRMPARFL
jgi:hypothetical protein